MSEAEVFTATAIGILGVRFGEDHVSGIEDGKPGNAVLVELTNTLAVPLDLAEKTVCARGEVLTGILAEADARTGKICNLARRALKAKFRANKKSAPDREAQPKPAEPQYPETRLKWYSFVSVCVVLLCSGIGVLDYGIHLCNERLGSTWELRVALDTSETANAVHRLTFEKMFPKCVVVNHTITSEPDKTLECVEKYFLRDLWRNSWWHASPSCKKGSTQLVDSEF